jgi:hypothetical protein
MDCTTQTPVKGMLAHFDKAKHIGEMHDAGHIRIGKLHPPFYRVFTVHRS